MLKGLTKRQKAVFSFINDFIGQRGYPPSLREICLSFGISSPSNAAKHLDAIERKGFIRRGKDIARAIEVTGGAYDRAVMVPIAGSVRAGSPHLAIEDIQGYVALDSRFFRCKGAFLLKVQGRSMTGAGIEEGDYLLLSPDEEVSNNDIAVVMLDNEATVKRFLRTGDTVTLKPENPDMAPLHIKEGSGRDINIIGKVMSVIKKTG
ncbi:MAG: repressor LexA [Deltaproteobacteria bacterium]|nr:repressor LexA [Deltaproteobacteria bacterium]